MSGDASGLSDEQIEVLARGLYDLAARDGIDEREERLIRDFLGDTHSQIQFDDLAGMKFSALEAAQVFTTSFHRRMFLRAAIAVIRADGQFSPEERRGLGEIADAFGVSNADFGDLEREAAGASV